MLSLKAFIVARREYLALVRTKAYLLGLFLAPALMSIAVLLIPNADTPADGGPREVALLDYTGTVGSALAAAAAEAGFSVSSHAPEALDAQARARLDEQVREGTLAAVLLVSPQAISGSDGDASIVLTVRNVASHSTLWLQRTLDGIVQLKRLEAAGIESSRARQLLQGVHVQIRLPEGPAGGDSEAAVKSAITPMFTLLLVFLAVMSSAPYMLHSVIEEKQQRIAEVLLGSMSPFDLMAGKLFGAAAAGLTVVAVYGVMGLLGASRYGIGSAPLSPMLLLLSLADVLLALVMFGSLFLAAGAAATELKDAQGLMTPLTLVMIVPMMAISQLIGNPDGPFAVGLSLFPMTAPMTMPLRLSITSVPVWQVAVSVLGTLLSTVCIVWIAGRIFRIGILSQGRAPRLRELVQWVRSA
jgi:ABC-2 type transport system permease protein